MTSDFAASFFSEPAVMSNVQLFFFFYGSDIQSFEDRSWYIQGPRKVFGSNKVMLYKSREMPSKGEEEKAKGRAGTRNRRKKIELSGGSLRKDAMYNELSAPTTDRSYKATCK